jgi:hypothetical protein
MQVGVTVAPSHGLTALPVRGMVWDRRRGMEMVEVPSSWRTVERDLSLAGDAVNYSQLRLLLKVVTGWEYFCVPSSSGLSKSPI